MRGEEKRSWWEHGGAGAHFPWENGRAASSLGPERQEAGWQRVLLLSQAPVPSLAKPQSNHGGKRLLVRKVSLALLPRPGPCGRAMSAHPGGHRRARTGLCGLSSGGEEAGVEEEVAGGRPGNCNSLWMGWTGPGGDRSQPSTSINLPSSPTGWSRGCSLSAGVRRDPVQLRPASPAPLSPSHGSPVPRHPSSCST